ncbi:MAG: hypothetical protein HW417_385 [Steroidobacteraceae bacterium]|nr:hypothetical protein [Steroidobacteraceae bacterium]
MRSLPMRQARSACAIADVVILGTGPRQRMPPPELFSAFASHGIGLEVMDTGAACRTYNLLLSEFREVAIALIV